MENTNVTNVVLDKKIEGYSFEKNDFIAPQEITITITLAEYRELVKKVATRDADIDKANADKYKRENEIKELTEEVAELKAKLYELQNEKKEQKEQKENIF